MERRIEFRRIKKIYQKLTNVHADPAIDAKLIQDKNRFNIIEYTSTKNQPAYLTDPDFYFSIAKHFHITDSECEDLSDSEHKPGDDTRSQDKSKMRKKVKDRLLELMVSDSLMLMMSLFRNKSTSRIGRCSKYAKRSIKTATRHASSSSTSTKQTVRSASPSLPKMLITAR